MTIATSSDLFSLMQNMGDLPRDRKPERKILRGRTEDSVSCFVGLPCFVEALDLADTKSNTRFNKKKLNSLF